MKKRGFTLIEIITCIALISLIGIGTIIGLNINKGKVTNSLGQQSSDDKSVADYLTSPTNNTTSMKYKLEEWFNGYLEDGTKERFSEEVKDLLD